MNAHPTPVGAAADHADAVDVLSDLLAQQAQEIRRLSEELVASYEKEIRFFQNLESRDKQLKTQERAYLKKVWWLESELRKTREERDAAREERDTAREQWERTRASRTFRLQRRVWKLRKAVRSWR